MKTFAKYMPVFFVFAFVTAGQAVGQVQVFAQVDTSRDIYVGESFAYNIIIDGENKPGQVDLSPLAKYNPQSAGNQDVSQTSISIMNGQTTKNIVKRFVMSYMLTTDQAGQIQLPPVTVSIDGQDYRTNPIQANISKPGTTDQLDIEVSFSEQQCYVGQPVVMTVNIYYFADIGDPRFNIPAFNSDIFYLEDPDAISPQARQFRLSATIEEPVFITQNRVVHNGKDAVVLSFSKVLIPKKSGQIQIEPMTVSANVAVGQVRSRDRVFDDFFGSQKQYKRFMVSSQAVTLTVLPLPEQNKPAVFYGLVGRYTISASASPTKVNVGDPITLIIKIGGSKYLKPVQWPELEQMQQLADNFKIPSQKSTPAVEDGFKVFTQTIRANNDKVTEIPPIPLCYFDPDKGGYVIADTKPIKLEVVPTKVLTTADLEGTDFTPVNKEVEAIKKGLSANYEGEDVLINMTFSPLAAAVSPVYMPLWALPLTALILSSLVKVFTHTTPEKTALKRRRRASGRAINLLNKVISLESQQRPESLVWAMKQYIGERFDKVAGSLTAGDCREIIVTVTGDACIADSYSQTIAQCEAARYASLGAEIKPAQIKEIIQLVRTIEKKSGK